MPDYCSGHLISLAYSNTTAKISQHCVCALKILHYVNLKKIDDFRRLLTLEKSVAA